MRELSLDLHQPMGVRDPRVQAPRSAENGGRMTYDSRATIEIVIAPHAPDPGAHRKNVGIEIDEILIQEILSASYRCVNVTQIHTRQDLEHLAHRKPDLVFSGVKYFTFDGEDLWLNDFLDLHGIAYIASARLALDNEHDKARAKSTVRQAEVATADYFLTAPGDHPTVASLPLAFPLFLKPVTGGDSRGVDANSVVHDFESFQHKVLDIHVNQKSPTLAETYLSGREYSVGVLEDASGTLRTMPIEIITAPNKNGDRLLDYDVKKQDAETVAPVPDIATRTQLGTLAKTAFRALSGTSLGRIDIKMNDENVPHFIEANLMPGLREGYFYRSCLLNLGMSYEAMILAITENGLASKSDPLQVIRFGRGGETPIERRSSPAFHGIKEPEIRIASHNLQEGSIQRG